MKQQDPDPRLPRMIPHPDIVDLIRIPKKDPRRYRAYWGQGYYNKGTRIVSPDFFSTGRGYDESDIEIISKLKVGQKLDLSTNWATHTIKRVK